MKLVRLVALALCVPGAAAAEDAMLVPEVSVQMTSEGASFTAQTTVPNDCYRASGTELGFPKGVEPVPGAAALQLKIHVTEGMCRQVLKRLVHQRDRVDLAGKTSVIVYVVVDGTVEGKSTVELPAALDRRRGLR